MSTQERPTIDLHGKGYPLIGPSEFSLGELVDCEQHFGATFTDETVNARKLAAILFISMKRVDSRCLPEHVRDITAEDLERINAALQKWETGGDALPPAEGASSASEPETSTSASNGSADTQSEHDPSSIGDLILDTGSPSVPLTSEN